MSGHGPGRPRSDGTLGVSVSMMGTKGSPLSSYGRSFCHRVSPTVPGLALGDGLETGLNCIALEQSSSWQGNVCLSRRFRPPPGSLLLQKTRRFVSHVARRVASIISRARWRLFWTASPSRLPVLHVIIPRHVKSWGPTVAALAWPAAITAPCGF